MTDRPIILDLCGGSGAWSYPYAQAGFDVRLVTLPDADVRTYTPPANVYGVLAAPPCTQFSFALNEKISRDIAGALKVVEACQRIIAEARPVWWALENPVGHLTRFLGKPAFTFQPWEFGDPWTKRTAIWGNFNAPRKTYARWEDVPKNPALYIRPPRSKPNMIWLHKSAKDDIPSFSPFPATTDADFRAITPQGFAEAFYAANSALPSPEGADRNG